jgi:type II secretory ATPase GspE/PulE/Tfp pilus assembly ATPase PilB-like protein
MSAFDESGSRLEFRGRLSSVCDRLRESEILTYALDEVAPDINVLLGSEGFVIYERTSDGREIASIYRSDGDLRELRADMNPSSLVGYSAATRETVRVDDARDQEELSSIHPRIQLDDRFVRSKSQESISVLVVPIISRDEVLGAVEILNKLGGIPFSDQDVVFARKLADALSRRMHLDQETSSGPYEQLLAKELITRDQLDEAEQIAIEHGRSVPFVLETEMGISKEDIGDSLETFYQVPFMGYDEQIILPERVLGNLNLPFLIRNKWIPIAERDGRVVILMDNPNDAARCLDIQRILPGMECDFMVGIPEDILLFLGVEPEENVANIEAPQAALEELVERLGDEIETVSGIDEDSGELINENAATVIQLVNKLIADAVEMGASDIHVEPSKGTANGIVRMRVDGVCRVTLTIPADFIRFVVARIKIMSKVDISETRLPQDGKITCRLYGQPLELRVATLPTVNGETVIMRLLAAGEAMPFDKLNLMPRNATVIKRMIDHPHGIILVVGPTGSGKTTTLHALLAVINTPERKILTAEDPVEITQAGLQQVQIRSGIGLDFARALRAFLRADPDVILIGEMRDYETAHSGIEASLTGHLVFTTLHTNSAPETITRLLDMGLDPLNFADALIGVLAQRLVRTLCPKCKEAYTPDGHEIEQLINAYGPEYFPELGINEADLILYRPRGCDNCGNTGYRGRTGIHEALEATQKLKELIVNKDSAANIRDLAMEDGMRTLLQDGIMKVFRGETDFRQVRAVAGT